MTALADPMISFDEEARIDVVRKYEILDTPPDGAFDRITALAARLFSAPIAIVSVVDTDRIWFKSHTVWTASPRSTGAPVCALPPSCRTGRGS